MMGFSDEEKILIKNLHDLARIHCGITLMILPVKLLVNWQCWFCLCYIQCDLFDCCIFNYEIMPATLTNTFLFILQGNAVADLGFGGRF